MKAIAGVTAIDCSVDAVTVAGVDPAIKPSVDLLVAVTVMDPADLAVRIPSVSTVAAPETSCTDHFTRPVRSWVLVSLNVPVAV